MLCPKCGASVGETISLCPSCQTLAEALPQRRGASGAPEPAAGSSVENMAAPDAQCEAPAQDAPVRPRRTSTRELFIMYNQTLGINSFIKLFSNPLVLFALACMSFVVVFLFIIEAVPYFQDPATRNAFYNKFIAAHRMDSHREALLRRQEELSLREQNKQLEMMSAKDRRSFQELRKKKAGFRTDEDAAAEKAVPSPSPSASPSPSPSPSPSVVPTPQPAASAAPVSGRGADKRGKSGSKNNEKQQAGKDSRQGKTPSAPPVPNSTK